jgi:hypothetical protein
VFRIEFCYSISVADPGYDASWIPGSGLGKKSRSGSGMNMPDHISESLETIFWAKIPKFFYGDPDPGYVIFMTLDPGWERFGSGINIPDPQH